jgi:1,4-dihydroxy-2-naphthoate octaprenyltransferase
LVDPYVFSIVREIMPRLLTLLRLSRPLYLLFAALTYALGTGIARYLGKPQIPIVFWLGLIGVLFAQMGMNLLAEVFRPFNEPILAVNESRADRKAIRESALYVSIAALAALAVIAYLFYYDGRLTPPALIFLGLSLLVIIIYSVPPVRLVDRGFGELLLAVQLAYFTPSIAFLLQTGDYHRLLSIITVPLVLLAFATFLAFDFPVYADDLKYARSTLLTRLSWERAVPLHHACVLAAYILFASAPLLGFSLGLIWPAFLSAPFAFLQIFWLRNIALGAKPIWTLLTANAIALLGLTAYFLTLTFWLR